MAKIPLYEVGPKQWQKAFPLGRKTGHSRTEWKNRIKFEAQKLFPSVKVTLSTADALLIMEYGRRQEMGS